MEKRGGLYHNVSKTPFLFLHSTVKTRDEKSFADCFMTWNSSIGEFQNTFFFATFYLLGTLILETMRVYYFRTSNRNLNWSTRHKALRLGSFKMFLYRREAHFFSICRLQFIFNKSSVKCISSVAFLISCLFSWKWARRDMGCLRHLSNPRVIYSAKWWAFI